MIIVDTEIPLSSEDLHAAYTDLSPLKFGLILLDHLTFPVTKHMPEVYSVHDMSFQRI